MMGEVIDLFNPDNDENLLIEITLNIRYQQELEEFLSEDDKESLEKYIGKIADKANELIVKRLEKIIDAR